MPQSNENEALRERLSRLSQASQRINESLDFDTVLQGVLDSARSLTEASYALITTVDQSGQVEDYCVSGLTPGDAQRLWEMPEGPRFFEYLSGLPGPLRVRDFAEHARSMGLPEFAPPAPVSSFIAAPIHHRGESVGSIHVAKSEPGLEFTPEDEETLVMFASQAALVIANARRYREEQRARAGLETLIDTSPVGVLVFDAKTGGLASINREARRIVSDLHLPDGSAEQLLGALTFRRADGREISLAEFPLAQALGTGEMVRAEEIVLQAPDGRSVTALVNATPIRSQEGQVESVVVTMQDLTPLEELERLRAEFLGMVSHELRVPLTSIMGSATALLDPAADLDPAEVRQFHRIILEQANHLRRMIGDLLDVARIETGTLPVAAAATDLAGLVEQARNLFLGGGGRHDLLIELPPDLPPVMADQRRIVQVLANLLSNAARHSGADSPIRVSAVAERFQVAISISDQGQGIAAERLPDLFRKFSRTEGAARDIAGPGLGLALCKGIVEAHGGRIRAESGGPGLGARFTFTLPAVEAGGTGATNATARTPVRGRPGQGEPARILVVDDDPQALRYARDALTRAGYAPVVTGDPQEALRIMTTDRPRLVLLDLRLPGIDGTELMGHILELADVPVIFLSAYGQDEVIARAFELGAADYVVKPFSPTELAARIGAALRRREPPRRAAPTEPLVLGELTLNYPERRVSLAGRPVQLTATEYRLLVELSLSPGRVASHEELLRLVWGSGNSGDARLVRAVVKRLRRKLGDSAANPAYILTEPRVGYRLGRAGDQDGAAL